MKFTGIARKIDRLGRITIPKEIRDMRGIKENEDLIEIYVHEDMVCLKKQAEKKCAICGTEEYLMNIDSVYICAPCGRGIANAIAKEHLKNNKNKGE